MLSSGHRTIIEHISFQMAFVNVSAFVEQFLIEFRLASFTVKSRRYVDFSSMGCAEPSFTDRSGAPLSDADALRTRYRAHMAYLFGEYGELLQLGIPREDARFLLPYAYRSNFYCTANARELYHILEEMIFGRGRLHTETAALGRDLLRQAAEICPFAFSDLQTRLETLLNGTADGGADQQNRAADGGAADSSDNAGDVFAQILAQYGAGGAAGDDAGTAPAQLSGPRVNSVELLSFTPEPERSVARAALLARTDLSTAEADRLAGDPVLQGKILGAVLKSPRPRGLEQVSFTFRIHDVSLAAVTHLTRHRLHSLLVPPLYDACRSERYLIPPTVQKNDEALRRYEAAFAQAAAESRFFADAGLDKFDLAYLFLSGNVIDVTTTVNGRELAVIIGLRTCNRAQWEVRSVAVKMLNLLREASPALFQSFGPGCYTRGVCPEGRMSCGRSAEMRERFGQTRVDPAD